MVVGATEAVEKAVGALAWQSPADPALRGPVDIQSTILCHDHRLGGEVGLDVIAPGVQRYGAIGRLQGRGIKGSRADGPPAEAKQREECKSAGRARTPVSPRTFPQACWPSGH